MFNTAKVLISMTTIIIVSNLLVSSVIAQPPSLPATYYGLVQINDADAPVNTTIIAKINGIEKGRVTTTEIGKYNGLGVYGDASDTGKTVQFYVDGILAPQTTVYDAGAVQEINLSVTKEIIGDFNNNGRVDIGDVAKVAYMVAGKIPPDLSADFNGNGRVDIDDATKIAYVVVGKISAL